MPEWYHPATLAEALAIRAEQAVIPIAGATDLYVRYRRGTGLPPRFAHPLLSVGHLAELRAVTLGDDAITIGAAARYTDLLEDDRVPLLLRLAIHELAAPALRNVGTLGGNVCNASPAADAVCPLYALDARCEVRSASGSRTVAISELITGPGRTTLAADELLTAIIVPLGPGAAAGELPAHSGSVATKTATRIFYRKVGTRKANALSKLSVAGWALVNDAVSGAAANPGGNARGTAGASTGASSNARVENVGIAFGAVGPTVLRSKEIESLFAGDASTLREREEAILAAYRDLVTPIDDQRSTADYRREVAVNLVRQFIRESIVG